MFLGYFVVLPLEEFNSKQPSFASVSSPNREWTTIG